MPCVARLNTPPSSQLVPFENIFFANILETSVTRIENQSTNSGSDKTTEAKTQQQAGGVMGTICNIAPGVVGTTGGILGGAVSAAGGVLGSIGRGPGEGITNVANTTESTAKGAGEKINETSGAKQQGKEQAK
ncbi:hypothetical protein KC361_g1695 [Hortaea werneckii]|nr:hypothetical protein KC361_g1695 [Hortaea werneckii]